MHVYILAGGFATRLWPISHSRAKPLLLLNGKPILELILNQLNPKWPVTILTNARFEKDIKTCLQQSSHTNWDIFIEDTHSDAQKLGALRALALASKNRTEEDMLVIAGDNYLPNFEPSKLLGTSNEAKLLGYDIEDVHKAKKFGVLIPDKDNNVIDFEEKPEAPKSTIVSTGFFFLGSECNPVLQEFSEAHPDNLGGIFEHLIKHSKIPVSTHITKGNWFDIGSFEQYIQAHKKIQEKTLLSSKTATIKNTQTHGKVFIADNCIIEDSILTDCIIYPNTTIKNCHISNTIIDEYCVLQNVDLNSKIIRKNTHLA
jgi:glucose-1-phosphate thymidylyltransferase